MADQMIFAKTGHHLNDLEEAILRGTMEGKKYTPISEETHCNESYLRDVGSKLWKILSEELGQKVKKSNFRSSMKRLQVSLFSNVVQDNVVQDHVKVGTINYYCSQGQQEINKSNSWKSEQAPSRKESQMVHRDLSEMPILANFYDRTTELETLQNLILQEKAQLITLTGTPGTGKTTLAIKLIQQIQHEFQVVVWCSLEPPPSFTEFQAQILEFFSQLETLDSSAKNLKPLSLIKYLQKYRCLVILDNLQNLLMRGELAGKYQPEFEDYNSFFKQITQLSHCSCFLLIGWEDPRELYPAKSSNLIHTLQLTGLDATACREILQEQGIEAIEPWETLISSYQGNPLWLKTAATVIQELGESESQFFVNDQIFLPENLKDILVRQFERLSEIEKQVMSLLAMESDAMNLAKLLATGIMPSSDLLNALHSLCRRRVIEKQGGFYHLPTIWKQYICSK